VAERLLLLAAATGLELDAALGRKTGARQAAQGAVLATEAYGRPVLALATGVGLVNAALAVGRALERHAVGGVVDFGVAGSFDLAAHPLRAVRLVERETWPEYGLLASGACAADVHGLGFPLAAADCACGEAVLDSLAWDAGAELARMDLDAHGLDAAESLSVSGVTADAARAAMLFERYGAGLENMEGFALAYACRLAGLPFAEVRAVSNAVGVRPPRGWDLPGALEALGRAARRLFTAVAP
jgi:futalosine hydrolase